LRETEAGVTQPLPRLVPLERAARHPIVHDGPAVDFFAGELEIPTHAGETIQLFPLLTKEHEYD
jgi:hypothetical protein